jgi:hypothetical protein
VDSNIKDTKAPVSPSKDASAQPDPGWKRLQTIFRKHQEQDNPTVESIKPQEPAPATNTDIQRTTEQTEPSKKVNDTQQNETRQVPQPAEIPPVIQQETNAAEIQNASIEHATAKPENKIQAVETQVPPVDRPAAPLPETPKAAVKPDSSQRITNVISRSELPIDSEEPNIEEEPEQLNVLPLESVWNVQKTQEYEPTEQPVARPTRVHHAPLDSATPKPLLQRSELESDFSTSSFQNETSMDADVTSEMRAPVEILAPSRPRPAPINPVKPSPTIQKQPQDQPTSPEIHEDRLVETAIGPLPADLWQLIGQKPPEGKPSQSTPETMPPSIPQQMESSKPQEEVIRHETSSQPVHTIKMVDFPAAVQREPAVTDTASSPEQPGNASLSLSQQNVESELDVDELARKVYARIRQRLSTEWERLRRR